MKTSITLDSAGRIVLPSEARRLLSLRPGSQLSLSVVAGRIELTPEAEPEPALCVAPSGRRVLAATGTSSDAAAATRAERTARASRGTAR